MENLLTLVPRKLLLWKVLSKQDERVEIRAETWPALALCRQNFSCKYQTLQSILSSPAFYADDGWRWASLLSFGQTFNLFWGSLIIIGRRGGQQAGRIQCILLSHVCWRHLSSATAARQVPLYWRQNVNRMRNPSSLYWVLCSSWCSPHKTSSTSTPRRRLTSHKKASSWYCQLNLQSRCFFSKPFNCNLYRLAKNYLNHIWWTVVEV